MSGVAVPAALRGCGRRRAGAFAPADVIRGSRYGPEVRMGGSDLCVDGAALARVRSDLADIRGLTGHPAREVLA